MRYCIEARVERVTKPRRDGRERYRVALALQEDTGRKMGTVFTLWVDEFSVRHYYGQGAEFFREMLWLVDIDPNSLPTSFEDGEILDLPYPLRWPWNFPCMRGVNP